MIINLTERYFIEWYLLNIVDEYGEPTPEEVRMLQANLMTFSYLRAMEINMDGMPEAFKAAKYALLDGDKNVIDFIADMIDELKKECDRLQL